MTGAVSLLPFGLPGILPRYFLRRYLSTFIKVLLSVSLLILLIDTIELSRRASAVEGFTLATNVFVSLLRTPKSILAYVQFIVLVAAMMTLLTLNRTQELVIARASGVSVWQFVAPLCAGSLLIGLVTVGIVNPLSALSMARAETIETHFGVREGGVPVVLPWFRQRTADGVVILGAKRSSDGGTTLSGAQFIFVNAEGSVTQRLDAQSAKLEGSVWKLSNAFRYVDGQPGVPLATAEVESTIDRKFLSQALTTPSTLPFFALPASVAAARAFGLPSGPYAMEFHSLIALPALLIAMTLIAATVSLRFARFGHSSAAIMGGVVAGFLLYVLSEMTKAFGAADVVAPVVAAWLPVIAAGLFGVTFLLHREDG